MESFFLWENENFLTDNEIDEEVFMRHNTAFVSWGGASGWANVFNYCYSSSTPTFPKDDLNSQLKEWAKEIRKNNIHAFSFSRLMPRHIPQNMRNSEVYQFAKHECYIETIYLNRNRRDALIISQENIPKKCEIKINAQTMQYENLPQLSSTIEHVPFYCLTSNLRDILDALGIDY